MQNLVRIILAIPVLYILVYPETGPWACVALWANYALIESLRFTTQNIMGLGGFFASMLKLAMAHVQPPERMSRLTIEPEPLLDDSQPCARCLCARSHHISMTGKCLSTNCCCDKFQVTDKIEPNPSAAEDEMGRGE